MGKPLSRIIPPTVMAELVKQDDWKVRRGGHHLKLFIGEKLAGVLPKANAGEADQRGTLNLVSQIRRARSAS